MAKRDPVGFTTPVGRLVWGSVHKAKLKTQQDGVTPKLIKSGAKQGQPLHMYEFGIAIPKTQQHWANEPDWGQKIWAEGHACWPNGQTQRHDFAWKVTDGDSAIPNKKQKKPCDQPGFAGCWILSFSGMDAPAIWSSANGTPVPDATPDLVAPGDEVQVNGSIVSNESDQTAGVHLNHHGVCWRGRSAKGRISVGPQVDPSGFGAGLAPGASAAAPSLPNAIPGAPAAPAAPVPTPMAAPAAPVPAPMAAPAAPVPAPMAAPAPAAPAPTPVAPNPAYTPAGAVPAAPGAVPTPPAPPAPPAPAVPAGPVMTALAAQQGFTYDALKTAGWNDQQMRDAGYLA